MKLLLLLVPSFLFAASSNLLTLAGTDGTTCKLNKQSGSTIYAVWNCTSSDKLASMTSAAIKSTSTQVTIYTFGAMQGTPESGDPLCVVGVNPTTLPASAGILTTIPINGIAWSCTGNKSGTAVWP